MPALETLVMCLQIERELELRRAERRARWQGLRPGAGRRWWRFGRRPAARITGTLSALPALAGRTRRSAAAGGA
ncbi:MAG: hypothetical protein C4290_11645, partial [Chloroflexota bacterium]